mgnify:CR=1 FL=1|jgi:type I restriction enzyme S subunit
MTSDWRLSTWGDEVSLEYGKALRGYQDGKLGIRVFGSNGPIGWTDKALAAGPGVILGRKGAYRGVHFSAEPFFVIDTAYYVQPKSEMDKRWLYYAIRHYKLGEIDDGSPIPSTTRAAVYVRELEVPPVSEQREIGRVLVALDDRINHNRILAANLERIARRLFKSWFVDFDPVRAKAAGEKPSGLVNDITALFPDRFAESELGEIPVGWKVGTLGNVCELNPETWSTKKHPDILEYIDLSNVKSGGIEEATSYRWDESPSRARRVLRCGDTIVGTVRPGNRSFALIATDGLTGSTGFAVLRPSHLHHREYLYLAATAEDAIERLAHLADGAAYPAVRPDVVTGAEVVLPNDEIMRQFSIITCPMFEQIAVCRNEASVLSSLRDLLLPRLISGKLRVEDAESLIEEAIA